MKGEEEIKRVVKESYKNIVVANSKCCSSCGCSGKNATSVSRSIGYSDEELSMVGSANLGLGCGNPVAIGQIKEGDVVLDLGSGAGIDTILAAKKVGEKGRVIGIDMTEEMVLAAQENIKRQGINNIEFIVAEIENIPLKDNSIDVIISNCVINLTPDKGRSFKEAYRVLKPGGKIYLSDIVLLAELNEEQRNDDDLLSGCVAGALLKEDYLNKIKEVGFSVRILHENTAISKQQYNGIALESLMVEATK